MIVDSRPVLVIDTETRHESAASAAKKIQDLTATIPARVTYKKTDSTLRRNIRAELMAFLYTDAIVRMYHDEGPIPFKILDFEGGVNVALGLGSVRTSVDHGTRFYVAGRAWRRPVACSN
jgi:4-hydroxy-L-threonine phosphate dehydrogenase PdxA